MKTVTDSMEIVTFDWLSSVDCLLEIVFVEFRVYWITTPKIMGTCKDESGLYMFCDDGM